jgi:hypothetical protein
MTASATPGETGQDATPNGGYDPNAEEAAARVAGGSQWNPLTAAALVGGAVAAGAGAYLGAKAIARRNAGKDGRINSVLCTAITAGDVKQNGK